MKKILALGKYLFKIRIQNKMVVVYLIALPSFFFIMNARSHPNPQSLVSYFILIAPLQTLLFHFGTMMIYYKETNVFIKYRLLGFGPFGVSCGLALNAFLLQGLSLLALYLVYWVYTSEAYPIEALLKSSIGLGIMNAFSFGLALVLINISKKLADYQMYAMISFYGFLAMMMMNIRIINDWFYLILTPIMIFIGIKKFTFEMEN